MSLEKVSDLPEWLNQKELTRNELEILKEIFPFYVVNTILEGISYRSIKITEYGWPDNVWNTGTLKEQLLYAANLTLNSNLFMVDRLENMSDACQMAHLDSNFYQYREPERIVVYIDSRSNLVLSIFKHIRNALAHGRFVMYPSGDDTIFVMESVDHSHRDLIVKARMVLRASTLLKWMEIIKRGPEDVIRRNKTKTIRSHKH